MEPWREPRKESESFGKVSLILESDDELEHGVKVQVRVVADGGEERVVLQTNVEMMGCSRLGNGKHSPETPCSVMSSCRRRRARREGCRTSLESREDEKAKTRSSP